MSSGPSRLVLALLVLTVLGLLAALVLLQDDGGPGQAGQPNDSRELSAPNTDGKHEQQQPRPPPLPPPPTLPPKGDLRRICNVCRGDCTSLPRHPFYHQLCPRCGDFNYEKRLQTVRSGRSP